MAETLWAGRAAGCIDQAGLSGGRKGTCLSGWVKMGNGLHLSAFSSPACQPCCLFSMGLGLSLFSPQSQCPVLLVTCVPSLQLVSDTRRMSDIQWFQEAYGAVTRTVRVVASEQSRQQRGWVFIPGELLTAFAPKA